MEKTYKNCINIIAIGYDIRLVTLVDTAIRWAYETFSSYEIGNVESALLGFVFSIILRPFILEFVYYFFGEVELFSPSLNLDIRLENDELIEKTGMGNTAVYSLSMSNYGNRRVENIEVQLNLIGAYKNSQFHDPEKIEVVDLHGSESSDQQMVGVYYKEIHITSLNPGETVELQIFIDKDRVKYDIHYGWNPNTTVEGEYNWKYRDFYYTNSIECEIEDIDSLYSSLGKPNNTVSQ